MMKKIYTIGKYIFLFGLIILAQQSLYSAPTQLMPQNGDDCVDRDATFEWSSVPNASHYMYLISTQADFSDTVTIDENYSDTLVSYNLPDNATTYYWKVGSSVIGQTDEWSDGFSLTSKAGAPVQVAPVDLAVCQDFEQTFDWDSIPSANSYRLMISATPNYSDVKFDTVVTGTSVTLTMNQYFQNYYWRVNGNIGACTSEWSETNEFRTLVGPPNIISPVDSAKGIDLAVQLIWPDAGGAQSYDLQVSTDENFATLLIDTTGLIEPTFNFTAPNYNQQLWWRLRTLGNGCNSAWSKGYTFKTTFEKAVALSPNDSARCVPLLTTFTWEEVKDATEYEVQASKTELFTNQDILFSQVHISGTTITGNVKNASARIYWRVRANDSTNQGLWSDIKSYFTTGDSPIALAPADGSVGVPRGTQIQWQSIGQAQSFDLQIAESADFSDTTLNFTNVMDLKKDIVVPKYNTKYYFRVRSIFNGCASAWSEVLSFTSIQGFPNLIYPENNDANITTQVLLQWSEEPYAQNYDFRIATDEQFVDYSGQNGVQSNSYLFSGLEPQTTYYWKVRSNDQWGTSPWSEVFTFTTGAGFTNVPTILFPEYGSVKVSTVNSIYWTKSKNATKYILQIATDRKFNDLVVNDSTLTDTVYAYTDLNNFTEYWVRVASLNNTTISDFSNLIKFRTIAIAPSDTAELLTPENNIKASVVNDRINFTWSYVPRTDIGLASESGYEFLLSSTSDFTDTLLYNPKVYEDGTNIGYKEEWKTNFAWKVRGWNEAGFGPWSEVFTFTVDDPTSVEDATYFDFGATLVPNPVENNAELRFTTTNPSTASLTIVDQTGKVMLRLENIQVNSNLNTIPLDFSNFNSGSYLFNLTVGNKHQTGKIIISK